jgi:hypothetical protein
MKPVGWRQESQRHALASKGIATGKKNSSAKPIFAPTSHELKIYPFLKGSKYHDCSADGEIWYVWYGDESIVCFLKSGREIESIPIDRNADEPFETAVRETIMKIKKEDVLPGQERLTAEELAKLRRENQREVERSKASPKYEFEIQGNYGYGWEMVTTEETIEDARKQVKCYNENEPNPHRIKMVKRTD